MRIISATVIEVSWRPPAVPNGEIIRYTVYLIPLTSATGDQTSRQKRQVVQSPDIISVVSVANYYIAYKSMNIQMACGGCTYNKAPD